MPGIVLSNGDKRINKIGGGELGWHIVKIIA
jgi:hypothetical protein